MIKNSKAQFNFNWMFAIIAGVIILFLAIYGVMQIGDTSRRQTDTEIAKQLAVFTDPLQAGFASGSFGRIRFQQETRINNLCYPPSELSRAEKFGRNEISVATSSEIGEKWERAGYSIAVYDKYMFSPQQENNQAEEFYVFSKPFYFPYKVSDLTVLIPASHNYCLISAPEHIEDELNGLNIPNINVENSSDNCDDDAVEIGFSSSNDIDVYGTCTSDCGNLEQYKEGYVEKDGEKLYYIGSLIYAAMFSDNNIYNCNVERLLYRTGKISEVFRGKADLMDNRGCNTNLKPDLISFGASVINASSDEIISLHQQAKQIQYKNEKEICGLW